MDLLHIAALREARDEMNPVACVLMLMREEEIKLDYRWHSDSTRDVLQNHPNIGYLLGALHVSMMEFRQF